MLLEKLPMLQREARTTGRLEPFSLAAPFPTAACLRAAFAQGSRVLRSSRTLRVCESA